MVYVPKELHPFKKRLALSIVDKFAQILQPGGYFVTSPQEAFLYQIPPFVSQSKEAAFVLQKTELRIFPSEQNLIEDKQEEKIFSESSEQDTLTEQNQFLAADVSRMDEDLNSKESLPDSEQPGLEPILSNLPDLASWEKVFLHEAVLKFQKQEYQQADKILARIIERDPTCYCAYLVQAYISQKQDLWEKSFEYIRKSRFMRPDTVLENYLLSQYLQISHKQEKAYQSAKRALNLYQNAEVSPLEFQLLEWLGISISNLLPTFHPSQKKGETFHV